MIDDSALPPGLSSASALRTLPIHKGHPEQLDGVSYEKDATFICDVEVCRGKTFKRKAELQRHQKQKHSDQPPPYPCSAIDCNRTRNRAFQRQDKSIDHMLKGHDAETLFACPKKGCSKILTMDLMSVHIARDWDWKHSVGFPSHFLRRCPMPKCPFQIRLPGHQRHNSRTIDDILVHLQEKHDSKGRMNFRALLSSRGYDAGTGAIVCPMCPSQSALFTEHIAFYRHFVSDHLQATRPVNVDDMKVFFGKHMYDPRRDVCLELKKLVDLRQHRSVLLSLWPNFANAYLVWDDIRKCPS